MDKLTVKPYEFDRNDEVLALLHRVFNPWDGDVSYFSWKYEGLSVAECPFPRGWVIEQDGKIVAFNGYLPRKIKVGERRIWALQSFDTVTDPDCRGRGLFGKLQQLIYQEVKKAGIPWLYGWTSEIGFKVFTRKVGWTVWGKQRFRQRVLDPAWFLQPKLKSLILAQCASPFMKLRFRPSVHAGSKWQGSVCEETAFPDGTEKLCESWSEKFELIAVRDCEYLNWRLANPLMQQRLVCAYEDEQLVGYLVHNVTDADEIDILDCVWIDENGLQALLADLENFARKKQHKLIRFRVTDDHNGAIAFRKAGYFMSRTEFLMLGHCIDCDRSLRDLLWRSDKTVYWSYFDRNE